MGTAVPAEVCEPETAVEPADQHRKVVVKTGNNVGKTDNVIERDDHGEHLQPLYQSLPEDLTNVEWLRAEQFIKDNAAIFSKSEFDIGRTSFVQHRIDTYNHFVATEWRIFHRLTNMSKRCYVTT